MADQVQYGVSTIQVTTPQYQFGISNVQATTVQIQTATASVAVPSIEIQIGIANLYGTTSQPQPGISNIYGTTQQTGVGNASIRNTTVQNQTGITNIEPYELTTRTQTGTCAIFSIPEPNYKAFVMDDIESVTNDDVLLGCMVFQAGLGFSRQTGYLLFQPMSEDFHQEFVRIPLFVSESTSWGSISTGVGFTLDGTSSSAGFGIAGNEEEYYVTLGILTNARSSQQTLEILATGNPHVDVTQVCYEMLWTPYSHGCLTQITEEVLTLINLGIINNETIETLAGGNGGKARINASNIELMYSIKAGTWLSQTTLEILATGNPQCRMAQVTAEILLYTQLISNAHALINSVVIEALRKPNSNVRVQGVSVESIIAPSGNGRINSAIIETMHNDYRNGCINSAVIEIVNNSADRNLVVNSIAVETMTHFISDPTVGSLVNNPHFHI